MYISSRTTTLAECKQGSSDLFVEEIDNPTYFKYLGLFTDGFDLEVLIKCQNIKFFCKMAFSFQSQKKQKTHPDINPGARHLAAAVSA